MEARPFACSSKRGGGYWAASGGRAGVAGQGLKSCWYELCRIVFNTPFTGLPCGLTRAVQVIADCIQDLGDFTRFAIQRMVAKSPFQFRLQHATRTHQHGLCYGPPEGFDPPGAVEV